MENMDTGNRMGEDGAGHGTLGRRRYLEQMIVGVVIGITVGLVLAVSAAIFTSWTRVNERREQIAFFHQLVGEMQEVCDGTSELKTDQVELTADTMRHFHLRSHARHLRRALDGRSTRLTFDEIYEVEDAHHDIEMVLDRINTSLPKGACSELVSSIKQALE